MRTMIVAVLALLLSVGCTNVSMTTTQVQDLSYMSGYASAAVFLVAQKPPAAKVQVFQADVQAVESALGTAGITAADVYNITSTFVKNNQVDPATAAMLNGLITPIIIQGDTFIQSWISTQPDADQIKTAQLAQVAILRGIDDACSAYLAATMPPIEIKGDIDLKPRTPDARGMILARPAVGLTVPTNRLAVLSPLAGVRR
jgi:hypothetical protein